MRFPRIKPLPCEHAQRRPGQRLSRRTWLLGLVGLWLAGACTASADTGAAASEYQVKATFIYNFTKFTDWPSSAFTSPKAPIVIGILGEDPFGPTMEAVFRGETLAGRPFMIKRLGAEDDLRKCHLLFISRSEKDRLPALLNQLKGSSVLTVSEINGFAERGGMINLTVSNKSVKVEINQAAAEQAELQISAKLLKLARLVK
jgi:hypothetical protein